jgi:DNA-binding response OmpR family regulator
MNILVIEDDPSVRTLVKAVLEHNGNSVSTADNATDGESNAINNEYDMIILDLGLPDGNGYEVCKNLRANNIETPVLILSGEQETDVKVKMLKV